MGCLFSRPAGGGGATREEPKVYSWDKRERVDPADLTVEKLTGASAGKKPGAVQGKQFVINDCKDSSIYIFDHTDTVTISRCTGCRIFLGPVQRSVFLRECTDCKFIIACQQFRTRDCSNIDVMLCCATLPIIEATTSVRFGCFRTNYFELAGQFTSAALSVYNNHWSKIHDFTPNDDGNWALLPEEPEWLASFYDALPEDLAFVKPSVETGKLTVPITLGARPMPGPEQLFVVFFGKSTQNQAKKFLRVLAESSNPPSLVQTREAKFEDADCARVFVDLDVPAFQRLAEQGPAIVLHLNGDNLVDAARAAEAQLKSPSMYISEDPARGAKDANAFFTYADMALKTV